MKRYGIVGWDDLYENAATRKLKKLSWVPIPNGADSLGFLRMREEEDFSDLYTGWILIVATASRCSIRGVLASSNGREYSAADLELKWRFPAERFQRTLDFCEALGWIENLSATTAAESATTAAESADVVDASAGAKERKNESKEGKKAAAAPRSKVAMPENLNTADFKAIWGEWIQHRKEIKHPLTNTTAARQLKMLSDLGEKRAITALVFTLEKGWQGIREPEGRDAARIINQKNENAPDANIAALRKQGERLK